MAGRHIAVADLLEGRLSSAERRAAEAHLETCSQCRAALTAAQQRRAQERTEATAGELLSFASRLVSGGLTLLAPTLREFPFVESKPEAVPVTKEEGPRFEPLRVLQPRVARRAGRLRRLLGRFAVVLLLTILVLLVPTPEGLSAEGHRALAVFVFTGSILALEPVSLPIAALMVPLATVALGVGTAPVAFETFSRPVVFLILASLFLARGLQKHGLTRRIALQTVVLTRGQVSRLLLGMMLIAAIFSMWVENTATAAVLLPVALTVAKQVPDPKKAKGLLILLVLGIAYSASLGGMVTVMGAASNAVAAGFLQQIRPWSFVDWMFYGLPAFLLVFPLTYLALSRIVKIEVRNLDIEQVQQQVSEMGAITRAERELLATLAVAIVLWVSGSFVEPLLNLPESLLSSAMIAVMAVAYLAIRNIIDWEDVKGVSWGIFLIIGAGLSLGETLGRTGATDWFAQLIMPLVSGPPLIVSMLLLVYLSALLTNVMNNTTIAAVFVPILISLARSDPAFNPVQLVLPVTLATTFGYSLPSASGRMALIAASGIVDRTDMLRYGLVMTTISAAVLGLFFYVLAALGLV
ncbi:MAG: DASS family sodium-coupled anion symporter [Candidatus Promineifilaceae bacterium]|nr:DASS family sodium-coupled anion symporter [Candidatus Promineifilaceae bacterium]